MSGMFEFRRLSRFLVACCALLLLAACGQQKQSFQNLDITGGTEFGKDFSLVDHHGQTRTLSDFKGKAVVMFFGFTQCPDVCPSTMTEMAAVMEQLGADADRVQVLFVTVDPERDTQPLLAEYVPHFDRRFLGMRPADEAALKKLASDFKVYYAKVTRSDGSYTMDHTAGSYVFDPQGHLRLFVKHGQGAAPIVHDLKQLL
jgi:protein SCO1/2